MKETLLVILSIICCLPFLAWIIRAVVCDPYNEEVKKGVGKGRALAMAIISSIVLAMVLLTIIMCYKPKDPETTDRWDEYIERREPGW